jgi:hypothetical protein
VRSAGDTNPEGNPTGLDLVSKPAGGLQLLRVGDDDLDDHAYSQHAFLLSTQTQPESAEVTALGSWTTITCVLAGARTDGLSV